MINRINKKELLIDVFYDIVGCLIFSVGVQSLSAPYNLPPGGVIGISMIVNHLTGLPISLLSLLINIPLLILAVLKLGKRFAFSSIKTVLILTVALEFSRRFIPTYVGNEMLAALFAGVIQGIGLGIVFLRGSTTGGTDILCKLVHLKFPHISIGRLIFILDAIILLLTAIVYKSVANAMYALITVFVAAKLIDSMIYGIDKGRMIMIISENYEKIYKAIDEELGRGSTLLEGTGTYTGSNRPVLICAVSTPEFHRMKKLIYSIDKSAFVVTLETDEVLGEGFKSLET